MNTPICDFVAQYVQSDSLRVHMPGHKGRAVLGVEHLDITEIDGADSLYEAQGIIHQSERNAGSLFGCRTFYSTEGSSQCIRAMLYLAMLWARKHGRKPLIAAGRNAHKTFMSAAALLDMDVMWLYPGEGESYLSCKIQPQTLDAILKTCAEKPAAVYLTSPDYLGNMVDIRNISAVCRKHDVLLLVDNAHGAYLKFLPDSMHPMDLGADICCDSAHKTLPVLTGGAYLHISTKASAFLPRQAKSAMAMFGSTSPSYLILQSLDAANAYLAGSYPVTLAEFVSQVRKLKERLTIRGYSLQGDEPLKITLNTKQYGYTGKEFAEILLKKGIAWEFSDPDFVVMMLTPETGEAGLLRLQDALQAIPRRPAVLMQPPKFRVCEKVLSIREAMLSVAEEIPVSESEGHILAAASVGCPPAVPVVVCGERIDAEAVSCFRYYGIEKCFVVTCD